MPESRHFPLLWTIEEQHAESFIVRDNTGRALGYSTLRAVRGGSTVGPILGQDNIPILQYFMSKPRKGLFDRLIVVAARSIGYAGALPGRDSLRTELRRCSGRSNTTLSASFTKSPYSGAVIL